MHSALFGALRPLAMAPLLRGARAGWFVFEAVSVTNHDEAARDELRHCRHACERSLNTCVDKCMSSKCVVLRGTHHRHVCELWHVRVQQVRHACVCVLYCAPTRFKCGQDVAHDCRVRVGVIGGCDDDHG